MSTRTRTDQAEAAGFEAIHVDLDNVKAGQQFQAKWGFKNTGSTTWDARYQLMFTDAPHAETANVPRSSLGAQTIQPLGQLSNIRAVKPGETMWVTLRFTAPSGNGTFATNWQLRAPNGQSFGPVRWMRLVVPETTGTSLAYRMVDFSNSVANFNSMQPGQQFTAKWTLQNVGTAVWSGDFQIAYIETGVPDTQSRTASPMGAPATTTLRAITGRDQVNPNERVEIPMRLTAPTTAGAYAFHWQLRDTNGTPFGEIRWLVIGVGRQLPTEMPIKPDSDQKVGFGMNVNINDGHKLDAKRMNGLRWVRFVFWASRRNMTPEEAYQKHYRKIIQTYADQGIGSLIILHQDTYWGNAPWDNGGWDSYAQQFGEACGRVARACSEFGDMVAYQIYNEQDSGFGNDAGNPNHSAIGYGPQEYAKVLHHASAAIRQAHPGSPIIFGGLKTGPDNALEYIRQVQRALGGKLPVDALAYHPYGRYVNFALFNYATIGKLGDALNMFKRAYPNIPLWITEVGAAADIHIGSEHYANIATYMREFVNEVANNYSDYVHALIWFGWTDIMRNSGINTADDKPKAHVFDAFVAMRDRYKGAAKSVDLFAEKSEATFAAFSSSQANLDAVPAGASFTCQWTFKNSGTTAWDKNFKLVYVPRGSNPDPMVAKKSIPVTEVGGFSQLEPDDTAVFTLNLTAPEQDGRIYRSFWQIRDPKGKAFAHFYVDITVVPAPPVGTSARTPDMAFLADHTIPDYQQIVAGTDFNKQWRVKNSGTRQWGDGFHLVYVDGSFEMARSNASHVVPVAKPGDEIILTVPMTAPQSKQGEVYSVWRLKDDRGNFFGDPLWAKIVVTGDSPTETVTATSSTPLARLLADQTIWYSQLDPRWRNDQLGFGSQTIGTWGCLMTCMSMALSANGTRITPQEMNQKLKNMPSNQGGFQQNSSVTPFLAPAYLGGLQYNKNVKSWPNKQVDWAVWTGENPISRIDQALAKGHIVVAQVDTRLNTAFVDQHWVVIVKRSGDDYQMLDPLTPPTAANRVTSLKARYMNYIPSQSAETNLRNAIISTMVYTKPSGSGN